MKNIVFKITKLQLSEAVDTHINKDSVYEEDKIEMWFDEGINGGDKRSWSFYDMGVKLDNWGIGNITFTYCP